MNSKLDMYPYAEGTPLVRDKRYSYSAYHGEAFYSSWMKQRDTILKTLPPAADDPLEAPAQELHGETLSGTAILAFLSFEIAAGNIDLPRVREILDGMVKRFEVFRRIHDTYTPDLRTVDKTAFEDLPLYVLAGEVFEAAYASSFTLTYLNVLIKLLDSICVLAEQLDAKAQARLARLIRCERTHMVNLLHGVGVELP